MKAKSVLPVLWQHQAEAIHASQDALKRGVTRQLVSIPTGGGKSRVAVEIVRARQGRALFIAHRQELLDQMREHLIGSGLAEKSIGIEKAERREIDRPVVIASVQTLSNAKRLARLGHDFTTLSIDEAHHSTALSYMRVLQHAGAFEPKGPLVLGITATPYRGDQSSLDAVYSEKVFEVSIPTLMKREILCPVRAIQVDLKVDFDKVKRIGGDFSDKDSGQALMKADAPRHVVSAYRQNALGRRTIVFCPTVEVSKAMMEAFRARKISAEHLDGTTPADERAAILGRLARGTTKVLTNCAIVGEGFDLPGLECVVMARPTLSPVLFAQCIGRGMRVAPGKTDCLIIDCVGASQRHNLMSTAEFFGVKGHEDILEHDGVLRAIGAREAKAEREGEIQQRQVELFRECPIAWHPVGPDVFGVSLGDHGSLYLVGNNDEWQVVHLKPHGFNGYQKTFRASVIESDLDLEAAQEAGEEFADDKGARALIKRDAAWHRRPISDGQMRWAPSIPGLHRRMTMGDANKLITPFVLRRTWNRWGRGRAA